MKRWKWKRVKSGEKNPLRTAKKYLHREAQHVGVYRSRFNQAWTKTWGVRKDFFIVTKEM